MINPHVVVVFEPDVSSYQVEQKGDNNEYSGKSEWSCQLIPRQQRYH